MLLLGEEDLKSAQRYWGRQIKDTCPHCHGTGYIEKTENGYKVASRCICEKIVNNYVRLEDYGLPRKFLHPKWNLSLIKDKSYYNVFDDYIRNFQTYYDNTKGLFLTGAHGRGKSTIECIIAKEITKQKDKNTNKKFTAAFVIYEDLINLKFDSSKTDILNSILYNTSLLIIDNVGNETGRNDNRFSQRFLEIILRKRDNLCLPTIISSNYSLDEIRQHYGDDVHDFIKLNSIVQFFSGENHRQQTEEESLWPR